MRCCCMLPLAIRVVLSADDAHICSTLPSSDENPFSKVAPWMLPHEESLTPSAFCWDSEIQPSALVPQDKSGPPLIFLAARQSVFCSQEHGCNSS